MNLENLKLEWSAMNDRMEKQEILKEKMFCQILNTKSDKSLSRLMSYEVFGLIFIILSIPVLFFIYNKFHKEGMELIYQIVTVAIIVMAVCVIWQGIKILVLSRIDFSKTLKNNLLYTNKYAIYIKYEKLINYFAIPLIVAFAVFHYVQIHASLYLWIFMSSVIIAAILFVIYLYRLYDKNISTIQQNLEELRELEEK